MIHKPVNKALFNFWLQRVKILQVHNVECQVDFVKIEVQLVNNSSGCSSSSSSSSSSTNIHGRIQHIFHLNHKKYPLHIKKITGMKEESTNHLKV